MKNRLRLFLPNIIQKVIIWREQKSINYNKRLWKYVLDLLILQIFHHEEPMLKLIWQKFAPRIYCFS